MWWTGVCWLIYFIPYMSHYNFTSTHLLFFKNLVLIALHWMGRCIQISMLWLWFRQKHAANTLNLEHHIHAGRQAGRQAGILSIRKKGYVVGRHDWFYYTSTKCAIPDDIAGQQHFLEELVTSAQHKRAKANMLYTHSYSFFVHNLPYCTGNTTVLVSPGHWILKP
jgi:hypothetical protein